MKNTALAATNLVDLLQIRSSLHPKRIAFTFLRDGENDEVHITYEELDKRARAIAAFLQESGLENKRVLLLYASGIEYLEAFWGCLYAKVTAIPAYPPNPMRLQKTLPRLQAILKDAESSAVLTSTQIVSFFKKIALAQKISKIPLLNKLGKTISSRLDFSGIDMSNIEWISTDTIDGDLASNWKKKSICGADTTFLQYTSGSTGEPKGVILTHENLLHNQKCILEHFGKTLVGVSWLPLYHDMGLIGKIMQPVYLGIPCIFMSPLHFLQKPIRWLQAISKYRGTTSCAPNFAYDLCVRKVKEEQKKELDLSSWFLAGNGAEVVQKETLDRFYECFKECGFQKEAFFPCYGLAEASLIVTGGDRDKEPRISYFDKKSFINNTIVPCSEKEGFPIVSCGKTNEDQKLIIVDPETKEICPPETIGEIWVCGPSISQGYWKKTTINKEIFAVKPLGWEGNERFLRTGDFGFLFDEELYIAGRLKDVIIVAGSNYSPQDIERTVEKSHPAIRQGCVAAFSSIFNNEEKLVVIAEIKNVASVSKWKKISKKEAFSLADIKKSLRAAINEEHQLSVKEIVLIPMRTINKTSSGKIQRNACKKDFEEGKLEALA